MMYYGLFVPNQLYFHAISNGEVSEIAKGSQIPLRHEQCGESSASSAYNCVAQNVKFNVAKKGRRNIRFQ